MIFRLQVSRFRANDLFMIILINMKYNLKFISIRKSHEKNIFFSA